MTTIAEGPLTGIKVVDLTTMISGPMATAILADQGADVIKVEPPSGDQLRYMGRPHNGIAACFFSCNRNKKSVCLDLKSNEGQDSLKNLILDADVFVQNFRPGAIERMGFGEDAVRAINPDLIYVSISGFGEEGPFAKQPIYDPSVQALSGMTDIQADKETKRPKMVQFVVIDKVTAVSAAQAISAALFQRERSGIAQHIRISMLRTAIGFHWPEAMVGLTYEESEIDPSKLSSSMDQVYKTKDGKFVTCSCVSDKEWAAICDALGKPDWKDDKRFNTIAARMKNADERKQLTAELIAKAEYRDILERFLEEGVSGAPLLTRSELLQHEQLQANSDIEVHSFEGFGNVRQASPYARYDKTPSSIRMPAPQLGEHTEEILRKLS